MSKIENTAIHVLSLSHYEPPVINEHGREPWVLFGEDNDYYNFLIQRYVKSPTNNAVINNIVKLIYGKGLTALNASAKPNEYAQMINLFGKDLQKQNILDMKLLGQFAVQVIYSKDRKKIVKCEHMPIQLLRAEKCNKDGEIEAYYYSNNWEDVRKYPPVRIPAFGMSKEGLEILFVKPYSVGMKYYSYVDYQGSVPYTVLEEEISNYLINEVQNGFSGTKVVNFNNGVPSEEQRDEISNLTIGKLTGTKGKRVIVAFNMEEKYKTTVDDIPLNDAPDHYTYLADECTRKILLAHNVTSPLLFGISSTNGFGSNADELQNSFILYYNMVIKPYQEMIIDAYDKILHYNTISLKLAFETLKPLEFTETQIGLSKHYNLSKDDIDYSVAEKLISLGEQPAKNWVLIDEFDVDYDNDESENEFLSKQPKQNFLSKAWNKVSTGRANPNKNSIQDENIEGFNFITRYTYNGKLSENTRPFCKEMLRANKIYRKEDIINMESYVVNKGWGPRGTDFYSIWLYKGGGACHHRWNKQIYVSLSDDVDINSVDVKKIAGAKAEKFGYVIKNPSLVAQLPYLMPDGGFLPK
jgi:hypothetical protein